MLLHLEQSKFLNHKTIQITGSKSESNRLLLLQALFSGVKIDNLSNSDDTNLMARALISNDEVIDINHAGTAMRFLTAYFAVQERREVILTGSHRMKERPIAILVDALKQLGADIQYLENEGYPPLKIKGRPLENCKVTLKANVSSQYISALLLIAPVLKNGLELNLEGTITSVPYIQMTLRLLEELGISTSFSGQVIRVKPLAYKKIQKTVVVESDWSSASYYYSMIALSEIGTQINLKSFKSNSLQGDSILVQIYKDFGVETTYDNNTISLKKITAVTRDIHINLDLTNAPDIAQTIAVTVFGLGLSAELKGLHTLKIKETDRLVALQNELQKLGADISITDNSLRIRATNRINPDVSIATYHDHRMAMAFAPLALRAPIFIEDANVVSKSYPLFWKDLQSIGFKLK